MPHIFCVPRKDSYHSGALPETSQLRYKKFSKNFNLPIEIAIIMLYNVIVDKRWSANSLLCTENPQKLKLKGENKNG